MTYIKAFLDFSEMSLWDKFFELPFMEGLRQYLPVFWVIRLASVVPLMLIMNVCLTAILRSIKYSRDNELIPDSQQAQRCQSPPHQLTYHNIHWAPLNENKDRFVFRLQYLIHAVYCRCIMSTQSSPTSGWDGVATCKYAKNKPLRCRHREFNDKFILWTFVFFRHFVIPYCAVSVSGWMVLLRTHPIWFCILFMAVSLVFTPLADKAGILKTASLSKRDRDAMDRAKAERKLDEIREEAFRNETGKWVMGWWWW